MLGRQIELLGDETEIVHLYYHIVDNFQIQFGREEFCLVTGLRFGVEYWADYNNEDDPIPFRRRVFSSAKDGKPTTGKTVEKLIKSQLFYRLNDDDAVSLCCVGIFQFVLLGLEDRRGVSDWILRVVAWSSKRKFYRHMLHGFFHGRLPIERLTPDEIEARSDWVVRLLSRRRQTALSLKVKNANVSPLNLGNAFADDNVGGDDVMFLDFISEQYIGNYLLYENVDPSKVFSTWMAFGGNTCDLGSFGEETYEITDLHQIHEEILFSERGDDVAGIKRCHRDPSSDGVKDLVTASGRGRLNEDLESST
ncbi:hypothetical protein Tco_0839543 [Tanacetum coccineum]|uniref:Phospholipase-like protein n=1 Tax=Tanacetum coccineum TaxID=301880 RepID=A0ABQ5AS23_9ASTR